MRMKCLYVNSPPIAFVSVLLLQHSAGHEVTARPKVYNRSLRLAPKVVGRDGLSQNLEDAYAQFYTLNKPPQAEDTITLES